MGNPVSKVFYDTNVLLDILLKRDPFYVASFRSLNDSLNGRSIGAISAISVADAFYISRKDTLASIIEFFAFLRKNIHVAPSDGEIIDQSLASGFSDMEDAIQFYTAMGWGANCFVTRNVNDFDSANAQAAELEILTPSQFVERNS